MYYELLLPRRIKDNERERVRKIMIKSTKFRLGKKLIPIIAEKKTSKIMKPKFFHLRSGSKNLAENLATINK